MIDFHSHILPGMDDGSSSVNESIRMLQASQSQGVTKIAATPHFYADKEPPGRFLYRREKSLGQLMRALRTRPAAPEIIPGAEVCYYEGITRTRDLRLLCIGSTNVLLLEMPFHEWPSRMVGEVVELAQNTDLTVLLAHIDRYLSSQRPATWELLSGNGVLFQANASCFLDGWLLRRRCLRLIREGAIAVLGSDCHNMGSRRPNLGEARSLIRQKAGEGAIHELDAQAERLLESGRHA